MSPLLFDLRSTSGTDVGRNGEVRTLAFTDHIVLLGEDERKAQRQVTDTLHKYPKGLGMTASGEKSQTFQVVTKKDTWFVKDPRAGLDEVQITEIDPDEALRYLGAKLGPWKGIHCGIIVREILSAVRGVRKLALKPHRKIELIRNYILARYIYHLLINPTVSINVPRLGRFVAEIDGRYRSISRRNGELSGVFPIKTAVPRGRVFSERGSVCI